MSRQLRPVLVLRFVFQLPGVGIGTGLLFGRGCTCRKLQLRILIKIPFKQKQRFSVFRLLGGCKAQRPPLFHSFQYHIFRHVTQREFFFPFQITVPGGNPWYILFPNDSAVRNCHCSANITVILKGDRNCGKALGNSFFLHDFLIGAAFGLSVIINIVNASPLPGNKIIGCNFRFLIHMTGNTSHIFPSVGFQSTHGAAAAYVKAVPADTAQIIHSGYFTERIASADTACADARNSSQLFPAFSADIPIIFTIVYQPQFFTAGYSAAVIFFCSYFPIIYAMDNHIVGGGTHCHIRQPG